MTPWEALGLEHAAASDLDVVKKAYARLLKQHRPDRDPEGFRRIRDAYEILSGPIRHIVLQMDGSGISATDIAPALGMAQEPLPQPPSSPSTPAPADPDPRAELWRAVADLCNDRTLATVERLQRLRKLGLPGPANTVDGQHLVQAFDQHMDLLAELCDDVWLLGAASFGSTRILLEVARHLARHGQMRLGAIVRATLTDKRLATDSAMLLELAFIAGLHHPILAQQLIDLAYPSLPARMRWAIERVELRLRFGFETERWSCLQRDQVMDLLDQPDPAANIPTDIRGRIDQLPYESVLRHTFEQRYPQLTRVEPIANFTPVIRGQQVDDDEGYNPKKIIMWSVIVLILIKLASFSLFSHGTDRAPTEPWSQPQHVVSPGPVVPPRTSAVPERFDLAKSLEERIQRMIGDATIGKPGDLERAIRGEQPYKHGSQSHRTLLVRLAKDPFVDQQHRLQAINHLGTMKATIELLSLERATLPQPFDQAVQEALDVAMPERFKSL